MSRLKATLSAAANKHTGSGGGSEFNRRNTAIASTRLELAAMTGNCGTVRKEKGGGSVRERFAKLTLSYN